MLRSLTRGDQRIDATKTNTTTALHAPEALGSDDQEAESSDNARKLHCQGKKEARL
jgi:hypothetical protein